MANLPIERTAEELDPKSDLGYLLLDESPEATQAWIEKYLTVPNELGSTVRMRLYPQQVQMGLDQTGRDVTVKSRQTRASSYFMAATVRRLTSGQLWGASAVIGAQDASTTMGPSFRKRVQHHMRDLVAAGIGFSDNDIIDNDQEYVIKPLDNRISWVSGEQRTMSRGFAAQIVHLSEFAHWKDSALELIGGVLPAVPAYPFGRVNLESTPKGEQGAFYQYAMKADRRQWSTHLYPWWMEPRYIVDDNPRSGMDIQMSRQELAELERDFRPSDYEDRLITKHRLNVRQILWRRFKKIELDATLAPFLQEYPEDLDTCWLGVEGKFFDTPDGIDHLEFYRDAREEPKKLFDRLSYRGADVSFYGHNFGIWQFPEQDDTYVMGFDSAGGGIGEKSDYSVLYVMSVRKEKIVARLRVQASPKVFALMVACVGEFYHGALVNGERSHQGDMVFIELRDLAYPHIYYHVDALKPLRKDERPQAGLYPTPANRAAILEKLKTAITSNSLSSFCPELIREMNVFTWQKFQQRMKASAMDIAGNHDDCIFAAAYAWFIIDKARVRLQRAEARRQEDTVTISGRNNIVLGRRNATQAVPRAQQLYWT